MRRPDVAALRNFLLSRKSCVTCVTGVTVIDNNDLAGYAEMDSSVTCVTGLVTGGQECPDVDERQAIAEIEGGIPPQYSRAFACLQVAQPIEMTTARWHEAIDDAGRFLDAFGEPAASLGWMAENLFAADGLLLALRGRNVVHITAATARLNDGTTIPCRSSPP